MINDYKEPHDNLNQIEPMVVSSKYADESDKESGEGANRKDETLPLPNHILK